MFRNIVTAAALAVAASEGVGAIELTPANWDKKTAGKQVFIKFLAPWCGHCKSMKPDWDKLMKQFKKNKNVLIADVDCTAKGEPLCTQHGVQGYPTLKYGDPNALEDYQGGRSFDDLKKFAEGLKPSCGPFNMDLCKDEEKADLQKMFDMPMDDLKSKIAEGDKSIEDAEANFKSEVEKLQKQYEQLNKDKEATIKEVKESGLGKLKSVLAKREKDEKEGGDKKKEEL